MAGQGLIVIVSIVIVVELKRVHGRRTGAVTVNPEDEPAVAVEVPPARGRAAA
jgi:hypothetical protein